MQFVPLLVALAATFSFATADEAATAKKTFKIKTESIRGNQPGYDGLFMQSYHTGAGFSAPTFGKRYAASFHFTNNSELVYDAGNDIAFYLALGQVEDLYAGWGAVTLNIPGGDKLAMRGYEVNDDGYLVYTKTRPNRYIPWAGWRACQWVHGVPELYYNTEPAKYFPVPANCELVHLLPVYD